MAQDAVAGASDSEVQAAVEDLGSGHLRHEVSSNGSWSSVFGLRVLFDRAS